MAALPRLKHEWAPFIAMPTIACRHIGWPLLGGRAIIVLAPLIPICCLICWCKTEFLTTKMSESTRRIASASLVSARTRNVAVMQRQNDSVSAASVSAAPRTPTDAALFMELPLSEQSVRLGGLAAMRARTHAPHRRITLGDRAVLQPHSSLVIKAYHFLVIEAYHFSYRSQPF